MKKYICILLVTAQLLMLAACSETTANAETDDTEVSSVQESESETVPEETEQMPDLPDIIFDNRVYDFGAFYNIGTLETTFIMMTMTDETNMAAKYASSERMAQKSIENLIKQYGRLG